jgi:hypothetical protein
LTFYSHSENTCMAARGELCDQKIRLSQTRVIELYVPNTGR